MLLKTLDTAQLLPAAWADPAPVAVLHPSIERCGAGRAMACLVDDPGRRRDIVLCRVDTDLNVLPDSAVALADHLRFAREDAAGFAATGRLAEPGLARLGDRLHLTFAVEAPADRNRIFLVPIDDATLLPAGPVREVVRTGRRRDIERGWVFFQHDGTVHVICDIAPLTILTADLSDPEQVVCTAFARHDWDAGAYTDTYGSLVGGTPPVPGKGRYFLFTRSSFMAEPDPAAEEPQLVQVGATLVLSARPPFRPLLHGARPTLTVLPAERTAPFKPPAERGCLESVSPAGAIADTEGVTVSYGVNGRYASLRRFPWSELCQGLVPVIRRTAPTPRAATPTAGGPPAETAPPVSSETHTLRAFWWRAARRSPRAHPNAPEPDVTRFVHGNFGDLAAPHLIGRLTGLTPRHYDDQPKLLTVGSLLQFARDGDVIWGTGINGARPDLIHAPRTLHVFATRGPISHDILRRLGHDVSRVTRFFDPVSLVGHLFAEEIAGLRRLAAEAPRNFIVIPHFRDATVMHRLYPQYADRIRSPDTPFFEMVAHILASDLVVSSSLHGLVVADALGVPSVWHRPLMGEDELKFIDYYLGTGRARIIKVDSLHDAFRVSPMPLPEFDHDAMLATFPTLDQLAELGVLVGRQPVALGRAIPFSVVLPDNLSLVSGWSEREAHGVWSDGEVATLDAYLGDPPPGDILVELGLQAYVPSPDRPQRVTMSTADGVIGAFEITHGRPVVYRFPLDRAALAEGTLRLTFRIPTALSPASIGRNGDRRRLGIALTSFRLRPAVIPTTKEPDLRLFVGTECHLPVEASRNRYRFILPRVDNVVRLVSRKAQPGDANGVVIGLSSEDRRRLGVGVRRISVTRENTVTPIPIDHPGLDSGWWGVEGQGEDRWRWTNGSATLPILRGGPTTIDVVLSHTTAYPLED